MEGVPNKIRQACRRPVHQEVIKVKDNAHFKKSHFLQYTGETIYPPWNLRIAPENGWLEEYISFLDSPHFQGRTVSFGEGKGSSESNLPRNGVRSFDGDASMVKWWYYSMMLSDSQSPVMLILVAQTVGVIKQKSFFQGSLYYQPPTMHYFSANHSKWPAITQNDQQITQNDLDSPQFG